VLTLVVIHITILIKCECDGEGYFASCVERRVGAE